MIIYRKSYFSAVIFLSLFFLTAGNAIARKVEITDATFDISPTLITNPYWPLYVGATYGYRAVTDDECEYNKLIVTNDIYAVEVEDGVFVDTRVVRDQEWVTEMDDDGNCVIETAELLEDTLDYYAQDDEGNIWYFGEDTYAKDDEEGECAIVTDGSWLAGQPVGDPKVDPAVAGIVMLDKPKSGDRYQQEYLEDEAEDMAAVLRLNASVSIDVGEYTGCLVTKEWTTLEPGSIEHKYYCLKPKTNGNTPGLVFIEELQGKTVYVEFVGDSFPAGLPGDNDIHFPSLELSCE